jgi:hypothetical protein
LATGSVACTATLSAHPRLPLSHEAVAQTSGEVAERVLSLARDEVQVVRRASPAEGDVHFGRVLSAEIRRRRSTFSGSGLCNSLAWMRACRRPSHTRPLRTSSRSGPRLDGVFAVHRHDVGKLHPDRTELEHGRSRNARHGVAQAAVSNSRKSKRRAWQNRSDGTGRLAPRRTHRAGGGDHAR